MGDSDLIAFIQKSRGKKRADEQIRASLLSVGWKSEKIDSAFAQIDGQTLTAAQKSDGMDYMPQNVQAVQKKEDARQAAQTEQAASQAKQGAPQPQQAASMPANPSPAPGPQSKPASAPPEQKPSPASPTMRPPVFPTKPAAAASASQPVFPSAKPAQASSVQPPQTSQASQAQIAPAQNMQAGGKVPPATGSAPVSNPSFAAISGGFPAIKGRLPIAAIAIVLVLLAAVAFITLLPKTPPSIQPIPANNSSLPAANNSTAPQPSPSLPPVPNPLEPVAGQNATAPPAPNASQPYLPSLPDGMQLPPSGQPAESPAINTSPQPEPSPVPPAPAPVQPAPIATPPPEPSPSPAVSIANNSSQGNQTNQSLQDVSSQYRQVFRRSNSLGYTASSFCVENELGNFIQLHYDLFYGTGCSLVKPDTGGFANLSTFEADGCDTVPCCVKSLPGGLSKKYDEIDCARN